MHKDYDYIRINFRYDPDVGQLMVLNKTEPKVITNKTFYFDGRTWTTIQVIFIYQTGDKCSRVFRKDKDITNNKWSNFTAVSPPMNYKPTTYNGIEVWDV
jgi:hypothetical protein